MYLSDILPGSCQCRKKKCDNSIQISWAYQKPFLGGDPRSPSSMFQAWLGGESNRALPQPCFNHDRRMYSSNMLPGSCQCWNRKCDNSIQITRAYQKTFLGEDSRSPVSMFQAWLGGESNPAVPQPCFNHDRRMHSIYYQGVISVEKGTVIIRYKLPELIKSKLRRWLTSLSCSRVSSMTMMVSRSHVSSMTGRCTCPGSC